MTKTPTKVEVLDTTRAYAGFLKVDVVRLRHERFDGAMSPDIVREVMVRGDAVALLPFDPKTRRVALIRQFLPGAFVAGVEPWAPQTIAGMVGKGEDPAEAARREAMEEGGLDLGRIFEGPRYLTSPGGTSETIYVYFAEADLSNAGGVHGLAEENEDIEISTYSLEDALALIDNKENVLPSLTVIALENLARREAAVRAAWA